MSDKVERPWKYLDGDEVTRVYETVEFLDSGSNESNYKGNLEKPRIRVNFTGYPLTSPIDWTQFPMQRLGAGMHKIEPGYGFPVHMHETGDELYLVLSGRGKILIDEQELDADPHDVFYMPSGCWHTGYNPEGSSEKFVLWIVRAPIPSQRVMAMGYEMTENMWRKLGL